MSGAVAAHAAYNGSGTQGLAVSDKNLAGSDIMSVFWNKNNVVKQLIHGSSIMEIPPTGNGGSLSSGGNQIFTVNDDIDAIGDLYLQITTSGISGSKTLKAFDLVNCIKRIEFKVGNQIWQTLEGDDINALNLTEMSEEAFESYTLHMSGGIAATGTRNAVVPTANNTLVTTSANVSGVLRIPCLTRTLGPKFAKFTDVSEGAYMLAGASAQKVQIKVTMKSSLSGGTLVQQSGISFSLKLFGQCMVMCNAERLYVRGRSASSPPAGLAKRIKMTQNSTTSLASFNGESTVNIDLDQFSLYGSHLVIQVIATDTAKRASIKTAELKLNSTSFSGELDGALLTGAAADSLGLYANGSRGETGVNRSANCYIFPLASRAYGGSSVPLNRFDNIRLTLGLITSGATAVTVNVTCVGQTTALYLNNAASLAMY